jgi:hypothetical protein
VNKQGWERKEKTKQKRGGGQCYYDNQIKEDEMDRACSTYWKDEKCTQNHA